MIDRSIIFVHGRLALGGAERLRVTLLSEMVRQGMAPRVCILREGGPLAEEVRRLGIPVDVLGIRGAIWDLPGVMRLTAYFRRHRPAIVQASQFVTNCLTTVAAKLAGVPLSIIEEHGHYEWKRWYHRCLDRTVNARADAVICCSDSVRHTAARSLGLPPERLTVIHNCVDAESLSHACLEETPHLRRNLGIPEDAFVFGTVGTLRKEKGHIHLLEAWREVQQMPAERPLTLVMVGTGPLEAVLRRQASDLPNLSWLGSRSDTGSLFRMMDAFVFPSVSEGLGIALLEAMFCERPVIASRTGGIPEVVVSGETGLLVSPGCSRELAEAMRRLAEEPGLGNRLSRNASEYVRQFHLPGVYLQRLTDLYTGFGQQLSQNGAFSRE